MQLAISRGEMTSSDTGEAIVGVRGRTRIWVILAVAVLHAAAIFALINAFGVDVVIQTLRSVAAYDVTVPPPPAPPPPPPSPAAQPDAGAAAPAARKAKPKEIVAPKPKVEIPRKAVTAPPVASTGNASASGAAASGIGTGGGGTGSGTGAGGSGSGGGAGIVARRAEKVSGQLKAKDFPRSGMEERDGRFIIVRYEVGTDGRVRNCRVTQSSGNAEADAITCSLIEKRFRYRPAIDAQGNPVTDVTGWKQWWWQ